MNLAFNDGFHCVTSTLCSLTFNNLTFSYIELWEDVVFCALTFVATPKIFIIPLFNNVFNAMHQ
jgi:hypothetical protein